MSVHYKFNAAKEYDTLPVDGLHISLGELKESIIHHKRLGKGDLCDLQVTNAETKEVYTNEKALIPKNSSLIIARIPIDPALKKLGNLSREDKELLLSNPEYRMNTEGAEEAEQLSRRLEEVPDLTKFSGTEEEKISAMIAQSTIDFHPSRYLKLRNTVMHGKVPPFYKCYKCHQGGHWVTNCPLNNQDLRKSTGIPSQFLVEVDDPNTPGVMITATGKYVIFRQSLVMGEQVKAKVKNLNTSKPPSELVCLLCGELLNDAVLVPCCASAFCDECIRNHLLDSDDHECPHCHQKDVGPDSLIPNRYLRLKVQQFGNQFFTELPSEEEYGIDSKSPAGTPKSVQSCSDSPYLNLSPKVCKGIALRANSPAELMEKEENKRGESDKENEEETEVQKEQVELKHTLVKDALCPPSSEHPVAEDEEPPVPTRSKKHMKKSKKKHKDSEGGKDKKHKKKDKEKKKKSKRKNSKDTESFNEDEGTADEKERHEANKLLNEAICPTFNPTVPPPGTVHIAPYPHSGPSVPAYHSPYSAHVSPNRVSSSQRSYKVPALDGDDPLASFQKYLDEKDRKKKYVPRSISRTPPYRGRSHSRSRSLNRSRSRSRHKQLRSPYGRSRSRSFSKTRSPSWRSRPVGSGKSPLRTGRRRFSPSPSTHHSLRSSPSRDRSLTLSRTPSPSRRFQASLDGSQYIPPASFPPQRLNFPPPGFAQNATSFRADYQYPHYQFNQSVYDGTHPPPYANTYFDNRGRGYVRGRGRRGFPYDGGLQSAAQRHSHENYEEDYMRHTSSRRAAFSSRSVDDRRPYDNLRDMGRSRERYPDRDEDTIRRRKDEEDDWDRRPKDDPNHRSTESRHSPYTHRRESSLERYSKSKKTLSPRDYEPEKSLKRKSGESKDYRHDSRTRGRSHDRYDDDRHRRSHSHGSSHRDSKYSTYKDLDGEKRKSRERERPRKSDNRERQSNLDRKERPESSDKEVSRDRESQDKGKDSDTRVSRREKGKKEKDGRSGKESEKVKAHSSKPEKIEEAAIEENESKVEDLQEPSQLNAGKEGKVKKKHDHSKKKKKKEKEKRRSSHNSECTEAGGEEEEKKKKKKEQKKKQKQKVVVDAVHRDQEAEIYHDPSVAKEVQQDTNAATAYLPELSKWEREDDESVSPTKQGEESDSKEEQNLITSDVLKRAENALFSKGINSRTLLSRRAYLDDQKNKESKDKDEIQRSPTPEWGKAETREARKKGASIQITISSKTESQIGRPKILKSDQVIQHDATSTSDAVSINIVDDPTDEAGKSKKRNHSLGKEPIRVKKAKLEENVLSNKGDGPISADTNDNLTLSSKEAENNSSDARHFVLNIAEASSSVKDDSLLPNTECTSEVTSTPDAKLSSTDEQTVTSSVEAVMQETCGSHGDKYIGNQAKSDSTLSVCLNTSKGTTLEPYVPIIVAASKTGSSSLSHSMERSPDSEVEEGELIETDYKEELPDSTEDQQLNSSLVSLQNTTTGNVLQETTEKPVHSTVPEAALLKSETLGLDMKYESGPGICAESLEPPPPFIKRMVENSRETLRDKKIKKKKRKKDSSSSSSSSRSSSSSSSSDSSSDEDEEETERKKKKKKQRNKKSTDSDSSDDDDDDDGSSKHKKKKKEKRKKKRKESRKKN